MKKIYDDINKSKNIKIIKQQKYEYSKSIN